MKIGLLLFLVLSVVISSCRKDCDETYLITGKFFDPTGDTPYTNNTVRLYYVNDKAFRDDRWPIAFVETGSGTGYTVNYACVGRADYIEAEYYIGSQHYITKQLPVNQNFNDEVIIPSKGTVKLYLQSDSAVGVNNNDTLFLAFHQPTKNDYYNYQIDTVLYFNNGLYNTYRLPTGGGILVYYGRGSKDFDYKPWAQHFTGATRHVGTEIKGDPEVQEITIKY